MFTGEQGIKRNLGHLEATDARFEQIELEPLEAQTRETPITLNHQVC